MRVLVSKRWKNATFALVALVLFVGALELSLRAVGLEVQSGGAANVRGWLFHEVVRSDADIDEYITMGARIYPVTPDFYNVARVPGPKPEGVKRIVCLGDSCTWGVGVEPGEAYPQVVEAKLHACDPERRVEMWNLGRPGYTSYQGRLLIESLWDVMAPDVLVFYFGANDAVRAPIRADKEWATVPKWSLKTHRALYRSSALYRLLRNVNLSYLRGRVDYDFEGRHSVPDWNNRVSRRDFFENRTALAARVESAGGRLIIVTSAGQRDGRVVKGAYFENFSVGPDDIDAYTLFSAEADAGRETFVDNVHPNAYGHRLLARELLKRLAADWGSPQCDPDAL